MNEDYTFVVRPYLDEFEVFYKNQLKSVWEYNLRFPPLKDYKDIPRMGTLHEGIPSRIFDAAYVIVDISLGLPNVYWEYAYALALGKPILLFRKNKNYYEENKRMLQAILPPNAHEYIDSIIERYFKIPSDVSGVLYESYDDEFLCGRKMDNVKNLIRKAEAAFDQAYERPTQICWLRPFQFEKYLERRNEKEEITLYYHYDDHKNSPRILRMLLEKIKGEINHILFYFTVNPISYDLFRKVITDHPDVGITPLKCNWKFILIENNFGYFSPEGEKFLFAKNSLLRESIRDLRSQLLDSKVSVESIEMLKHMIKMQRQIGLEDVVTLKNHGFAFDEHSKLWIVGPNEVLKYVSNEKDAIRLCGKLQNQISIHFAKFATDYLKDTNYIIAFWPLNEESVKLAIEDGSPIRKWVEELNRWVEEPEKKGTKGNKRLIDRFFVIPREKGELVGDSYRLKDDDYKQLVIKFFKTGFNIDNCTYRENLYIVFDLDEVVRAIFSKNESKILRQNAILFSKDTPTAKEFRGVLQFETPIFLDRVSSKILNFRYWKLPKDFSLLNEEIADLVREIIEIKEAKSERRKVLWHNCLAIISVDQFLKDLCET